MVLQALDGRADALNKGYVSTLDLAAYVAHELPRLARDTYQFNQRPTLHSAGEAFALVRGR